jgi:hypothetical protein
MTCCCPFGGVANLLGISPCGQDLQKVSAAVGSLLRDFFFTIVCPAWSFFPSLLKRSCLNEKTVRDLVF